MTGMMQADDGWDSPIDRLRHVAAESGGARQDRPTSVDDVPQLAGLLDLVGLTDRIVAQVVDLLIELRTTGAIEATTGVGVELWLAQVGRRTRADVRMLACAADLLPHLPGIHQAFCAGRLSWSQVRAILLAARPLPLGSLADVDAHVCAWIEQVPDADPDSVTQGIATLAWQLDTDRQAERLTADERDAEATQYVAMQPRIDGTGGRIWGELAADGFATLDAALNHDLDIPAGRGDFDDPGDRVAQSASAGRQRAERLIGWANHHLAGCGADASSAGRSTRRARPTVLLRTTLDTLLGGALPGELLTHLAGGRLHVTSQTARRIVDEGGADLRMIVLDDTGSVVGVGDRSRVPPDFVSDTAMMVSATCEAPGCNVAVRVAQDDHARPWTPLSPDERRGPTDVGNNGRLCTRHNVNKERAGWRAIRTPDGVRRWHHPRSGLTATHLPDHWQPSTPRTRPPTGADPPSGAGPPNGADLPDGTVPPDSAARQGPNASRSRDDPDLTVQEWLQPPDPDLPF